MKKFNIPGFYRSSLITAAKNARKAADPRKKDFSPTILDFGPVRFVLARHFGFCYGVENAIEISYRTIEQHPDRRIYLISEMIHNPIVNDDLRANGIDFLMDTAGNELIPIDSLTAEDIVLIPAFGTTIELKALLESKEVQLEQYDTTCPFVTKVWKRAAQIGQDGYSIVVHGKAKHEETRATFSHSKANAPTVIVRDLNDTALLAEIIEGKRPKEDFYKIFEGKYSEGFDPEKDLKKIGVVNQTTMLATETQEIADFLKQTMILKYGESSYKDHFADTRDTLCYATNDNQNATYGLLEQSADLAIVVGGYNSSNTSHLVELCEEKMPTYFISTADKILDRSTISHFDIHSKTEQTTTNFLPEKEVTDIILTSGASCPDRLVEEVLEKLLGYFSNTRSLEVILEELES